MVLFDWIRFVLGVGVAAYAFSISRRLRGGKMEGPFQVFSLAGIVGACSGISDALNIEIAHEMFGVIFYVLLFIGFALIYRVWISLGK